MKWGSILGTVAGVGLSAWLLQTYGLGRILGLLAQAGWAGLGAVVAFHVVQILPSAAGWRAVSGGGSAPGLGRFMVLRWMREAVNNLLPVAQIGGEFVAARLLHRDGVRLAPAIAWTVADLTVEMITQIVFTLMGLALLVLGPGQGGGLAGSVAAGLAMASLLAAGFLAAQWLGLGTAVERLLLRLGRAIGWHGTAGMEGLQRALIACYRPPWRVLRASGWHMASWLLGGLEVCLALHVLGHDVGLADGLVIESLGQALKAVGFAVPGALGVQEGGYIVICAAFGLQPEVAIALSLIKRLREVVLGVPGLVAWQVMERQGRAGVAGAAP